MCDGLIFCQVPMSPYMLISDLRWLALPWAPARGRRITVEIKNLARQVGMGKGYNLSGLPSIRGCGLKYHDLSQAMLSVLSALPRLTVTFFFLVPLALAYLGRSRLAGTRQLFRNPPPPKIRPHRQSSSRLMHSLVTPTARNNVAR